MKSIESIIKNIPHKEMIYYNKFHKKKYFKTKKNQWNLNMHY